MKKLIVLFVSLLIMIGCKEKETSTLDKIGQSDLLVQSGDTLDYEKIYGLALTGEVTQALDMLDTLHRVAAKDSTFKSQFEKRFKYKTDRTACLSERDPALKPLLKIYQKYWRKGLTHKDKNYDKALKIDLLAFFH